MERRKHSRQVKDPASIADLIQQFKPLPNLIQQTEIKPRCRFDMFVRYHQREKRQKHEFCYRGDFFEKDPEKMLWSLVRMFTNNYGRYFLVMLYDNTKAMNDPARTILKFHSGIIVENRLKEYASMLLDHPVPDWLK